MEEDSEKSQGKPESIHTENSLIEEADLLNETSNGLIEEGDINFVPSSDFEESNSQQTFHGPVFDNDDATAFQDTSINEESNEQQVLSDTSHNGDSNIHVQESAADDIEHFLGETEETIEIHKQQNVEITNETSNLLTDNTNDATVATETVEASRNDENLETMNDIENMTDGSMVVLDEITAADEEMTPAETPAEKQKTKMVCQEADTEVVSEDELPGVRTESVQDAENVSDDELPAPKPAELPADTEVVSEDELPATSKRDEKEENKSARKRKPDETESAPESDPTSKKQAVSKNGESKPVASERRSSEEKEKKKKPLPELEKYWKVVREDSSDFTGWTYLLQYVDQENDVEAARTAYDEFLSHYPYCYGYWRKYADYEKRKGSKKKCNEVLERGLKAIPLSVDLWIHYLNHIKSTKSDDLTFIRQQYNRAIDACGLEFRSDRLWESYIKWEGEHGTPLNVTNIYDRLLATPTLGYTSHFDNFQEHIMSESVTAAVSREEIVRVRAEVREGAANPPMPADLPPGEDEPEDHIASEEEAQAIKERIIAMRRKVHKATGEQVTQRWTFEEGIKRPYFHVKPLERSQLKNWKSYLEWEKQHGSFKRALVLHERCLIACALYQDFWMRLIKFLEEASRTDSGLVGMEREVLERACLVHHPDKPALHLHWAYFEEINGSPARAAEILEKLDKTCPNLLMVAYRRINLERRRGDLDKCCQLYENYISTCKSKSLASALSINYARFLRTVRQDADGARRVLGEAVGRDPLAHKLYLQQVDAALADPGATYAQLKGYLEAYERVEGAELEIMEAMAAHRFELAEELGSAEEARDAYAHHKAIERRLGKRQRQGKHEAQSDAASAAATAPQKKKEAAPVAPMSGPPPPQGPPPGPPPNVGPHGSYYGPPPSGPPQVYDQPPYQQQYQPQWNYQQHPPNPYHHNPWGQYQNYY